MLPAYRSIGHRLAEDLPDSRQFLANWHNIFGSLKKMHPVVLANFQFWIRQSIRPWIGLNNVQRFTESIGSKRTFFDLLEHFPSAFEIFWTLMSRSPHLAELLIRNPEDFYWLIEESSLGESIALKSLEKQFGETVFSFDSPYRRTAFIHRLHRRHFLRIALRDLLGISQFTETADDLSQLAETLVRIVTKFVLDDCAEKPETAFSVVALGKLGGNELNYSSDIDLMFVYESDGITSNGATYNQIFQRCSEDICRILNEQSEHGMLYRVDTRLRPDGTSGILCQSLSAYLHYYESRGRLWERQMLLKARPVAGDLDFGHSVLKRFEPFIYPKRLKYPLEEIVSQRKLSETRTRDGLNVKTDPGGIRDIEFLVQALQLQFGGQVPEIRTGNTLGALRKLAKDEQFLSRDESDLLIQHYIYLRHLEHALQLQENLQVHVLPDKEPPESLITAALNQANYAAIVKETSERMREVRKLYREIFGIQRSKAAKDYSAYTNDDWVEYFTEQNFPEPSRAAVQIRSLAVGQFPNNYSTETRHAFWDLCQRLLQELSDVPAPSQTLNDFERIIRSYNAVGSLYKIFAQHGETLRLFLQTISKAQRLVLWIVQQPELIDKLLSIPREKLAADELNIPGSYSALVDHSIKRENWLEQAIRIHHRVILSLISRWIAGQLSYQEAVKSLSLAHQELLRRSFSYHLPDDREHVAVILAGSTAKNTMTISSDIDALFFVSADTPINSVADKVRDCVQILQGYNIFGKLLSFDFRLRPEGKSAPLLMNENDYNVYLENRMQPWEFQAMHSALFLWGDADTGHSVLNKFQEELFQRAKTAQFWQSLLQWEHNVMNEKLSRRRQSYFYSPGGLFQSQNTLEWQVLLRTFDIKMPDLAEKKYFDENLLWLRQLRWYLSLNIEGSLHHLSHNEPERFVIAQLMGFEAIHDFENSIAQKVQKLSVINNQFREWLTEKFE